MTSSQHAHFCWPESSTWYPDVSLQAQTHTQSQQNHSQISSSTKSIIWVFVASYLAIQRVFYSNNHVLHTESLATLGHFVSAFAPRAPPDSTFSHKPTQRAALFLTLLHHLRPTVAFLFSLLELSLWARASCTRTISVMLSNGLEAQVRTDLTAAGLISRNTWWVPALMPRLIYEAWDRQQPSSEIKTYESHS